MVMIVAFTGCGGDPSAPSTPVAPGPATPPPPLTTITISSSGMSSPELTVASGTRVTFTNNDSIPHDIRGGPEPARPDCPEIDAVGFLVPGQSKQTEPLFRTCDYHDHSFHSPLFNGRIVIR